ncbi:sensor domain-containing diguanylate cyclase [Butyrivibrio sp. AE3004]|uniref:sensor domain-containing diguanylate cyclase n=1 Tax=Butyrivibrio sp. AE3004 TaxID=1506994 RepID=UPI00049404FE|nr:diguanylate cyclase [Butyrivibrio sp. AE3004]
MKSIQEKITLLTTIAILMVALIVGGTAIYTLRQVGNYDSARILNLTCETETNDIDRILFNTEEAVNILADYAVERLFSVEKLASDEAYRDSYTVQLANLFSNIAANVPGTVSYYVHYNPEIMPSDSGLLYIRDSVNDDFTYMQPTDINLYDPDDIEHVVWWYEPVRKGGPTWVEPYHNANLEKYLISYIVPLYENGVLIGIAGMDIDFYSMIDTVKAIKCYETGYACLVDNEGLVYYNPLFDTGTKMEDMGIEGDMSFESESNGSEPLAYSMGGIDKQLAYRTLSNGMRLIITAPVKEILAMSNELMRRVIISTILVLFTFLFLTIMVSRRITSPLKSLARVAREINDGKLEVVFPKETKDEVGELTHAMEKMVHHLKHHIDDLNSLAYHDSLTGVKNKTAYDDAASKLDLQEGDKEYGIVVFDANNLKKINDTYGHERGNIYLQNACRLTCRIFKGSPVFRIGGDEFVVILQGEDYDNCYKLLRDFDVEAERHNMETTNEWEKINIAKGMVKYDPETDSNVESVFKRADARMYVAKQKMKLAEMG